MTTKPMFKEAKKADEPTPFEKAQANIRACVALLPDYDEFVTWQRSGEVLLCQRDGETEYLGMAFQMTSFNALLEQFGAVPLEPYTKQKRPATLESEAP